MLLSVQTTVNNIRLKEIQYIQTYVSYQRNVRNLIKLSNEIK